MTPGPLVELETDLRSRLGWFLLVRLLLVSMFLGAVAAFSTRAPGAVHDLPLILIATGYGVTAISGLLLPSVRRIVLYTAVQIALDLGLVSIVVVLSGGLESPLAVLYNLVVLNAALLRLDRGVLATAAAAALVYSAVLAAIAVAAGTPLAGVHLFTHATNIVSFFAIGVLARYLTRQLSAAQTLLARQREELGRIETLQRLVANAVESGLVVTDGSGRITSANPTAIEMLGGNAANQGVLLESLLPGAAELAADGPSSEVTVGDGEESRRVLRIKAATLTDTYQRPMGRVYVLQDITTVRDMEARLSEHERIEAYAGAVRPLDHTPVPAFEGLIGESDAMRRVFSLVEKAAPTDSTILITGESGTGKELVARAVHARSLRAHHPFVAVNCGAIPETLIESELFGHVRGAFTGAVADRQGLFRQAHRGTIFLDEIGELPLTMQVRLLRVLQDKLVTPVGSGHAATVDVRVVAATNRDIERLVAQGGFREDLYYRLNVIRIATPSLRERPEDIPLLLLHMLQRCSERHGKAVAKVSPRTMRALVSHPYPGNIRELENIVDHAITLCEGDALTEHDLPPSVTARPEPAAKPAAMEPHPAAVLSNGLNLDDQLAAYEKEMLVTALDHAGGVRKRAAELLGIKYRSLRHRLSKYGLGDEDDEIGAALHE